MSCLKSPIARSMWGRGQFGGKRYNLKKDLSHEQMFTNICFVTLFKHVYNNASITISSQIWDMNINERIKKTDLIVFPRETLIWIKLLRISISFDYPIRKLNKKEFWYDFGSFFSLLRLALKLFDKLLIIKVFLNALIM